MFFKMQVCGWCVFREIEYAEFHDGGWISC